MCEKCGCSDRASHHRASDHDRADLRHLDHLAEQNRMFFQSKRVLAINVLSFSSSSARPLLRQTVAEWGRHRHVAVVDSVFLESIHAAHDHESSHCHAHDEAGEDLGLLDAHKISHALHALDLDGVDVLLLENGGSAACQALNDLGEVLRVAVFSVRDGELKPLKFPPFFQKADAVVIQDMDQADALGFDLSKARANVRSVAPQAALLEASARTGTGLGEWYAFLEAGLKRFEA